MKATGFILICLFFVSCVSSKNSSLPKQKTQLQVREYQTRTFETNDGDLVLKAALNVLQDDGFIVKNAVTGLGLLTASKDIQLSGSKGQNTTDKIIKLLEILGEKPPKHRGKKVYKNIKQIEVSVNVTVYGTKTKVRANFQAKILNNDGSVNAVQVIDDKSFYQEFFAKVSKGIFLQQQGL